MLKYLKKDLIIPAGTRFNDAPLRVERTAGAYTEAVVATSVDTSAFITIENDVDTESLFASNLEDVVTIPKKPVIQAYPAIDLPHGSLIELLLPDGTSRCYEDLEDVCLGSGYTSFTGTDWDEHAMRMRKAFIRTNLPFALYEKRG